jgi:hypothetical protein
MRRCLSRHCELAKQSQPFSINDKTDCRVANAPCNDAARLMTNIWRFLSLSKGQGGWMRKSACEAYRNFRLYVADTVGEEAI